jgi:hypothetical protein
MGAIPQAWAESLPTQGTGQQIDTLGHGDEPPSLTAVGGQHRVDCVRGEQLRKLRPSGAVTLPRSFDTGPQVVVGE